MHTDKGRVKNTANSNCLKTIREFGKILIADLITCLKTCSSSFMLKTSAPISVLLYKQCTSTQENH